MFFRKGLASSTFGYTVIALLAFICSRATLLEISPFLTGFFLALVFLGCNVYISTLIYLMSAFFSDMTPLGFVAAFVVGVVVLASKIIENRCQKRMGIGVMSIVALIGQMGFVYTMAASSTSPLSIFLTMLLSILFMYSCICFLRPVLVTKLKYKLLDYEIICGCVFMIVLFLGIGSMKVGSFPIVSVLSLFTICIFSYAGGVKGALISGICIGIGVTLMDNNIAMMACYPFVSLLVAIFFNSPRILASISGVLAYTMFVFYFGIGYQDAHLMIIGMSIGGAIFCILPKKQLEQLRSFFSGSFSRTALRYVVNHNRREIGNALYRVGDIFYEMSGLMSGLKNDISHKNVEILYRSVVDDFCSKCVRKAVCGSNREIREGLWEVIRVSVAKGRASVVDLPLVVTENCMKIAQLITFASDISAKYNRYIKTIENENAAKNIVSEQLLGVSLILRDMAVKEAVPISFELAKERAIMEELTYRNIVCSEAMISTTERGGRATLVVLTECLEKRTIEKVFKKVLGCNYNVVDIEESIIAGWSVVHAEASPKYDVVFGFASCPKYEGESSGDTHSFIKIHNNKFMMALCDGMGSGDRARSFSSVTISLIENFYKAGFEHSLVLESVNKFLSLSSEETFSAVDVCVVDLETAEVDVIKIGSPASYIKSTDSVVRVDGSALPIGMLEELRPSVSTQKLNGGDMIVLTTDGISDSFCGDELASLINNLGGKNPQQLCQNVAESVLAKAPPKDDMTIAAVRIFKRVS